MSLSGTIMSFAVRNVVNRSISTSSVVQGKKNFRKFIVHNKRGTRAHKLEMHEKGINNPRGLKTPGYKTPEGEFVFVPEMQPELIVPDLTGCDLKPYVSYRAPDVIQSEFTAKDLFDAVYAGKITKDFEGGKLDESGNPTEPSPQEKLTAQEAFLNARKTGSDIF